MHTRRIATFLLGAWIGCTALMAFFFLQTFRLPGRALLSAPPAAAKILEKVGNEDALLLLRYQAAEEVRENLYIWELAQMALAVVLLIALWAGTQKRVFPLALCGLMLAAVVFQHFAVNAEMVYRGREADFPPGNRTFSVQARLWATQQIYFGMEGVKLLVAGILGSYLFVFRTGRIVRKKVDAVDHADHSHVDR